MAPIGIAMIGCGIIASSHFEAIKTNPDVSLVATLDLDAARAEEAARSQGAPRWYTSVDDLLNDQEVEACIVGLPHYLGFPTALDVVRSGRHCLVEKPMALNLQDARTLVEEAEKAGVVLASGQVLRHRASHVRARELIHSGAIGTPVRVRRTRFMWSKDVPRSWATDPQKTGGWLLYGYGTHEVDIALWVNDTYATTVYAQAWKTNPIWNDYDEITAILTLENGGIATVELSLNTRATAWESIVVGTEESMTIRAREIVLGKEAISVPLDPTGGFGPQLEDFVRAIREGTPLVASGADVLKRCILPLEGIKRSIETGQVIQLATLM